MEASGDGGTREEEVAFSHRTENAEFSASRASICTRSPPLGRPKGGVGQTDRHRQASRSTLAHAAFLANGRSAVKPGLFCEPSGQDIIQSYKAPV